MQGSIVVQPIADARGVRTIHVKTGDSEAQHQVTMVIEDAVRTTAHVEMSRAEAIALAGLIVGAGLDDSSWTRENQSEYTAQRRYS